MNNPKVLKNSVESGHSNDTTVEGWQLGNQFGKLDHYPSTASSNMSTVSFGAGGTSGTGQEPDAFTKTTEIVLR